MATAYELPWTYSRDATDATLSDESVRKWRVVKKNLSEIYVTNTVIGVSIGDPHPLDPLITCVSINDEPSGDSRYVREVTATYRTIPSTEVSEAASGGGGGGGGGKSPQSSPPQVRKSNVSSSTTIEMVPKLQWVSFDDAQLPATGRLEFAVTPAGDYYEPIMHPEPVTVISFEQFEDEYPAKYFPFVGCVNKAVVKIATFQAAPRTLLLRSVRMAAHTEMFNGQLYWGWMTTFELAYRENSQYVTKSKKDPGKVQINIGWDTAVPQTGFGIINKKDANEPVDVTKLALQHINYKVKENANGQGGSVPGTGYFWATDPINGGSLAGKYSKAMVPVPSGDGGWQQVPAAQPVALNNDGSPRDVDPASGVFPHIYRRGTHPVADFNDFLRL